MARVHVVHATSDANDATIRILWLKIRGQTTAQLMAAALASDTQAAAEEALEAAAPPESGSEAGADTYAARARRRAPLERRGERPRWEKERGENLGFWDWNRKGFGAKREGKGTSDREIIFGFAIFFFWLCTKVLKWVKNALLVPEHLIDTYFVLKILNLGCVWFHVKLLKKIFVEKILRCFLFGL